MLLLLLLLLTFSALVANPEKTTLHGGQSRSWSAEQGKKKKKSLAAPHSPPPPPRARAARSEKIKNKKSRDASTCYAGRGVTQGSRSVSRPYKDSYDSSAVTIHNVGDKPNVILYTTFIAIVVSHIQRIGRQRGKTTLHNGQSRSLFVFLGFEAIAAFRSVALSLL